MVSRIRDAGYGLVAHGSLAAAAPTATTAFGCVDYGAVGNCYLIFARTLSITSKPPLLKAPAVAEAMA